MSSEGLLQWQWKLYPDNHRNRTNLLLHILSNPLFIAGVGGIVAAPILGVWWPGVAGFLVLPLVMAVQGRGHRLETVAPVPFSSAWNFVARILLEQLITFPRFVLSGGWARAWRASGTIPAR